MLTEKDVVDAICAYLRTNGYEIHQALGPKQKGDDIVAIKKTIPSVELHIEAKGETSSRSNSNRYGKKFNNAQVRDHIGAALYKVAEMLTRAHGQSIIRAGIALPMNQKHVMCIEKIKLFLDKLGIVVFWVNGDNSVKLESSVEI